MSTVRQSWQSSFLLVSTVVEHKWFCLVSLGVFCCQLARVSGHVNHQSFSQDVKKRRLIAVSRDAVPVCISTCAEPCALGIITCGTVVGCTLAKKRIPVRVNSSVACMVYVLKHETNGCFFLAKENKVVSRRV